MKNRVPVLVAALVITASLIFAAPTPQGQPASQTGNLQEAIINALLSLPHYGVFDNLAFEMDGTNVTLLGQALLPITKSEAGKRVAKIPGIGKVTNKIEVLPVSMSDDSVRMTVYRNLFGTTGLYRYAMGAVPSIHIIVKGGHVTLEGLVSTKDDSQRAEMAVKGIAGVFSIKNNLKIEK